ncbi:MAG TPA: THUMP domain-containing protein, partial [Thermoanaerobaculia bacterium]|nr:THUMP domain-containing protein [Thermoanaerobaculia bacterium]
ATAGGLALRGNLAVAYRACLWSRLASRILMPLWRVAATSSGTFYDDVRDLPWEDHLVRGATFAVDAHARGDRDLNTHFVALKAKDAIVDRLRSEWGERPSVDPAAADLRLHVLVERGSAQLSLDLAGEALHRRGYRTGGVPAPLKENVAAAVLLRAGWPAIAAAGGAFVDPMCGSGTLLAEAAMLAGDVAPGLLRERFGFAGWRGHQPGLWKAVRAEAAARRDAGRGRLPPLAGADLDARALELTRTTLAALGVVPVELRCADVGELRPPPGVAGGLIATNAPYGQRVGDPAALPAVYRRLGEAVKARCEGWTLALLTADPTLAGEVRMRPFRRNALWNGGIRCELLQYRIGRAEIPGLSTPRRAPDPAAP